MLSAIVEGYLSVPEGRDRISLSTPPNRMAVIAL